MRDLESLESLKLDSAGNPTPIYGEFDTRANIVFGLAMLRRAITGKKMRGMKHGPHRPDLIFLDDLENDENVRDKGQREKVESFVLAAIIGLAGPGGGMDVFWPGTSLHYDAAINRVSRKPGWRRRIFRSITTWPDRMDLWDTWEGMVHEHKSKSGYIESQALFRVLAWLYAYKAYNTRDMQRFLEVYGMPLRLGKFPAGISKEQRNELLKAVRNIGNDGAGIVPATMSIEFVQAQGGEVRDFVDAIRYWEAKESMAILGGTLTSQADGKTSTNALGVVHNEVRREIMLHDVQQIDPTMNAQIIRPIVLLNGMFAPDRMPRFEHDTAEAVDQKAMVEVLEKAARLGMRIDVEWAHNELQIPIAGKDASILGKSGTTPPNTGADAALVRLAALAKAAAEGDTTGAYAAQLAALCAPYEQAQIQQIAAAVAESGDFAEALGRIEALALKPAAKGWTDALANGMAAANLAGRSEV